MMTALRRRSSTSPTSALSACGGSGSACPVAVLVLLLLPLLPSLPTAAAAVAPSSSAHVDARARNNLSVLKRLISQLSTVGERQLSPDFNTCGQEEPFPCKTVKECISLKLVCDGKSDCSDGWDEDESVCTAYQRLPVTDFEELLSSEARWMVPAFFAGIVNDAEDLRKIAHLLVTSRTADEFVARARPAGDSAQNLISAMQAVRNSEPEVLLQLGMPASSWENVRYAFGSLLASSFL